MSWNYSGHFAIGSCGCGWGIQSHSITLSQSTITCLIIWIRWCDRCLTRRLSCRKTCSSPWTHFDRNWLDTTWKLVQWRDWVSFQHTFSILFGRWDFLEIGTREWHLILRMRHPRISNSKRSFRMPWRMNTMRNINVFRSIILKAYHGAISSPLHRLQDPVNYALIHMNYPVMKKIT